MKATQVALFVMTVGAIALAACGGSVTGNDDAGGGGDGTDSGGGTDTGGGSDSGGGGHASCPSSPPAASSSCTAVGLACEYGKDPNVACNQVFQCASSGWTLQTNPGCATGGQCPASYAAVPQNGSCQPVDLECSYPQGLCICSDGGGPARAGGPEWSCFAPVAGCPNPRPAVGSACTEAGLQCNYGACFGGVELQCVDGTWQQDVAVACPV